MNVLRVPGGGAYCFTDAEMARINECSSEVMRIIKRKSLTIAETMEVFEQCKALVNESLVK